MYLCNAVVNIDTIYPFIAYFKTEENEIFKTAFGSTMHISQAPILVLLLHAFK